MWPELNALFSPRTSVRRLPVHVVFILQYLADKIQESRHYDDEAGKPDPSRSRWFSMEKDRLNFPWVFSRGDKSSRVIATLESLAVLLALKAFYPLVMVKCAGRFDFNRLGLTTGGMVPRSTSS